MGGGEPDDSGSEDSEAGDSGDSGDSSEDGDDSDEDGGQPDVRPRQAASAIRPPA